MKAYYYDHWTFPLPTSHRFPDEKYALLRRRIEQTGSLDTADLKPAPPAADADLLTAHAPTYIKQIRAGRLSRQHERELGLPMSPELGRRVRRTVGATIAAGRVALVEGVAASTGGGTHHAQYDRPQGFCIFNDAVLQKEGRIKRGLVIDCDVHQGNGTALMTAGDPTIFTFSIHCQQNFPARKAESDLDIPLSAGVSDKIYLEALKAGLDVAFERAEADLVIYLAGADPFEGDRLGKLKLSKQGLAERDDAVLSTCLKQDVPVVITMAGGYGKNITDTVDIYHETIRLGADFARRWGRSSPGGDQSSPLTERQS